MVNFKAGGLVQVRADKSLAKWAGVEVSPIIPVISSKKKLIAYTQAIRTYVFGVVCLAIQPKLFFVV